MFAFILFPSLQAFADDPGWKMVTALPVSPTEAKQILEAKTVDLREVSVAQPETFGMLTMGAGPTTSETEITPEIEELARALQHDPKLIFNHVRNHIEYVPTFGSVNGATATLLAGRGNDFDQASLFIALMRESGYTANYVMGDVLYTVSNVATWLGVDADPSIVGPVLASGGIPVSLGSNVSITRVWATANIDGADYVFDPAFKTYEITTGIDIPQAMNYDQSSFLNAAGGSFGADYVQNMSSTGIESELQTYSTNLVDYIKTNSPNAAIAEIIGGRRIDHKELSQYPTSLPNALSVSNQTQWTEIDDAYQHKMRIQHQGIDHTFNTWEIAEKRVTIFYTGADNAPELKVDGETIQIGDATTTGEVYDLNIWVDHPYSSGGGTYADQNDTFPLKSGSSYNILCSFETVSGELIALRNKILAENRTSGQPDQSDAVLGETLHVMGLNWLNECQLSQNLSAQLAEVIFMRHHSVGVMAQETGYYIDVKISAVSVFSKHGHSDDAMAWFRSMAAIASAFEHGMLEQLQGAEKPGASTVKLLHISNSTNNKKTFYADSTEFNWEQLQNYSQSLLDSLQSGVATGYRYVLPEDANITLNDWQGTGYIGIGSNSVAMIIAGDYNGGYSGTQEPVDISYVDSGSGVQNHYVPPVQTINNYSLPLSEDPVDLSSGAFVYNHSDLSMGGRGPMGLNLARSYNSHANKESRSMGHGWTHNYDIYLEQYSQGDPVLGGRAPIDAASAIAAFYVISDIMKDHDDLQGWLATCLVSQWAIDQLINNAVAVHLGGKSMAYIKLADGSYNPPPGMTAALIKNGDTFTLEERFATTLAFNSDNKISSWQDADGNTLAFTYSGDKLNTVQDAFNRSLTYTYTGDWLTSIADSSGRTVSYSYDGNDDLINYTDPEGKVWSYRYDDTHRMTNLTNPLTITTATNTYDSLGRVDTQTVPRKINDNIIDVTYNFYFSGFRNIEEDPEENQTIYYFDDRGRTIGIENALGHKSTKEHDGQNHIVSATDPRSNTTTFEYDSYNNLKKSIGALSGVEFDTEYDYDSQFRKTDIHFSLNGERQRHVSHFDYDGEHHLTGSTTYPEAGQEILVSSSYYPNGLPNTRTDGRGIVTTMAYDTYGNPDTTQVDAEPVVDYTYNAMGQLVDLTDQAGSTTYFEYDDRGLITSKTDPLGKITRYNYYDDGKLYTITDRNSHMTTYGYTPSGKMETITYHDSSTVDFEYDIRDNLHTMQDGLGTTTYDLYDAANRLKSVTDPHGFTVSYEYDEAGNIIEIGYPGNKKVIYSYDAMNRLKTVNIDWLGMTATYYYDETGRVENLDHFNGTWASFGYDDADRLTDVQNRKADLSAIATYHFTLDGNGNRTFIDQTEPLTPIVTAATIDYTYNDEKNRLMTAGSSSFSYDLEGQLNDKDGTSYSFDYEHRLINIGGAYAYYYDGMGQRLKAVRNSVETRYIYDAAGNLLAEADQNNVITRYYIYGQGLLAMVTASDEIYCYHFNAIGSTIAMTDSSQNMVNQYAYSPFGIITSEQETFSQPFKFVGQHGVMTEPNGLYYMRARFYDPTIGRFISEDPLGFDGGDINLYVYVLNNPINLIDPFGLWGINYGGSLMGIDFSATLYDSNKGWFPSTTTDIGVSTTAFGGGIQITFDTPVESRTDPCEDVNVSMGMGKYLGVTYNTELSRGNVNLGLGLGLPITFSTPVQNFAEGLSNSLQRAFK